MSEATLDKTKKADAKRKATQPTHPPGEAQILPVHLTVNGKNYLLHLEPWTSILDALCEHLKLAGTKKGCDHGQCGSCTILANGKRINSCLTFAIMYEGVALQTIEGFAKEDVLHPVQKAFIDHDAFQCGYCTPGQICSAIGMLNENRAQTKDDIHELMSGNLCRCGAYHNIVDAILHVMEQKQNSH